MNDDAQNKGMGTRVKGKGGKLKGGIEHILLFLWNVNRDISVGGKRSTMHVSPFHVNLMSLREFLFLLLCHVTLTLTL
jgi:hypothetical protein